MADKEIVLVTGGNTGLGYETIKALMNSSKPYHVILGSRDESKGASAVQKLSEETSGTSSTVETVQIDVSSDESIHTAVKHIQDKFGKLDALVNNAGECSVCKDTVKDMLTVGKGALMIASSRKTHRDTAKS